MELNFINISVILTAIRGLVALITDMIKLSDRLNRNNKLDIYKIESANLKRTANPRFGFSYIEPRTWDRFDPVNGDGNGYVHPTKTDVSYVVSGMHDVFKENEITTTIENYLKELKKVKGFKLLLSRASGIYCYDYSDEKTVETEQISAWRLKYKLKDKQSRKHLTVLELRSNYKGVCFTVYCQAPNNEYDNFEDFFLFLRSEFRILREKSESLEITAPSNNILSYGTKGRLRTSNLIEASFWLSVNIRKRPPSNVNIIPSEIKLEPEKGIEKIEIKINPRAYAKRESGASFVDLSLEKDNTLIYFSAKICFSEEVSLEALEELKETPMILSFYITVPGYMDNKFFQIPMKDFFVYFIKAFNK